MLHLYFAAFGAVVAANIIVVIAMAATTGAVFGRYGYGQMCRNSKKATS